MSQAKAKLYRTAIVASIPFDGSEYRAGDIVSVELVGKGAFGWNFRIKADYLGRAPEVMSEFNLKDFCL